MYNNTLENPPRQKAAYVNVAVVAIVFVLAFARNPLAEQHRTRIKDVIAERSPIAGALGIGLLAAFTSMYHFCGAASYTTINERIVSVGAFGMIFVRQSTA